VGPSPSAARNLYTGPLEPITARRAARRRLSRGRWDEHVTKISFVQILPNRLGLFQRERLHNGSDAPEDGKLQGVLTVLGHTTEPAGDTLPVVGQRVPGHRDVVQPLQHDELAARLETRNQARLQVTVGHGRENDLRASQRTQLFTDIGLVTVDVVI